MRLALAIAVVVLGCACIALGLAVIVQHEQLAGAEARAAFLQVHVDELNATIHALDVASHAEK